MAACYTQKRYKFLYLFQVFLNKCPWGRLLSGNCNYIKSFEDATLYNSLAPVVATPSIDKNLSLSLKSKWNTILIFTAYNIPGAYQVQRTREHVTSSMAKF